MRHRSGGLPSRNRVAALSLCLSIGFSPKPVSTFGLDALDVTGTFSGIPMAGGAGGRPGRTDDRRQGR
ncbi:hypothetical protein MES4922_300298 [Mesorhizobium ventifaucium]|uniref:Propionyl-coenzyme A carboxylase alpha polypeptide n=1 Tax=Mesorhizobium ventifaucium TaxID=666020 RepID=A0ABM9E2B5_9HYPH|nr:hypothetical protein MES4922_300298 [Mesorhizobium ventifaucium]